MIVVLNILIYLCLHAGVHGSSQISWLPCQFSDSREVKKDDGQNELEFIDREAMLQFGQKGDAPLNPRAITFLVTGSKVDLRQYLNKVEPDEIECALRRYNTQGIHVRWPVQGASEFNYWFSCTLKHKKDLFKLTSFLRHPSEQPPSEQNYQRMPIITDGEVLVTSVAMVMQTQTPSLKASLGDQRILHCQFAIDHKGPNVSVEWHKRGERTKLFSHTSHTRKAEGSGVELKRLALGDASYHIAFTKISNEGKHVCSVSVIPLFADLEISLRIEVAPRVSLNVGPHLSLQVGKEQKFACEAEGYYPLEVDIVWYKEDPAVGQRTASLLPNVIPSTLLSGHKQNSDRTYSLTSFFYLTASLSDSEKRFICSVSHQSLRVAIKKSFILTVEEPSSWISTSFMVLIALTLMLILIVSLRILHQAR